MTSFLLHILRAIWHRRATEFWPIWITMTGTAAICVAWVVGHATITAEQTASVTPATRPRRYASSVGAIVSLILLVLLLACYVADSFKYENFADGDDHFFTLETLKGQDLGLRIWPEQGRFFPLGLQEFNLIRRFTGSVVGYHAFLLVQLLIVCCLFFFVDDELSLTARTGFAAVFLILPATVVNFTELVTPDRKVVFLLLWLLLFVMLFERTGRTGWAVAAAVSAQAMIYYKETAFLLLLGFAVARLFLRCWRTDRPGFDIHRLRSKESRLDFSFILISLLFLPYYLAAMMPHPTMQYADKNSVSLANAFLYYLKLDLLAWCLGAVFLRRIYLILRHRALPQPLWDGLALGSCMYFAAFLYLRLTAPYYLEPVDLIAVLYVGRWAILSWDKMRVWQHAAVSAMALVVLLQALSFSAFILFERKNVIHAKDEIADVIVGRYDAAKENPPRLVFPFAGVYPVTEFASYLAYRGIPVETIVVPPVQSAESRGVALVTKGDVAKDGPCVDYMDFVCHAGSKPVPGDLAIELPDDHESFAEMSPYRNNGVLLFSYEPHPHIPQWLFPLTDFFRVASVQFERNQIPDRWLHASVTVLQ